MIIKKNRAEGSLFWGCPMYPACKVTMPLEARAHVANVEAPENVSMTPGSYLPSDDQQRLRAYETALQRQQEEMDQQRRDLYMQQQHVTQAAMAQQQQQEVLASAQQQLLWEHQAMSERATRVPAEDSDDLSSTP